MTPDQSAEIEELLEIWYRWNRVYRAALGAPRAAPYARDSQSGDGEGECEDDDEATDARLDAETAEQVEACIDSLPDWRHRSAIGLSMANKHGPKVFRHNRYNIEQAHALYQEAKKILMPMLRRRQLMRT